MLHIHPVDDIFFYYRFDACIIDNLIDLFGSLKELLFWPQTRRHWDKLDCWVSETFPSPSLFNKSLGFWIGIPGDFLVNWLDSQKETKLQIIGEVSGEGGVLGISGCFVQSSLCMKHDPNKNITQVLLIDNNQESFWFPVLNPVLLRLNWVFTFKEIEKAKFKFQGKLNLNL